MKKSTIFSAAVLTASLAMLLTCACAATRPPVPIADRGQSDHVIVIAGDGSPSQRYAAEELQRFLQQICGARLPIAEASSTAPSTSLKARPMILVGRSETLDALSLDIDFHALGDEGLVIRTVGPHVVLAGGGRRGTLYAVYEFLDRYLGCRWFAAEGVTPAVSRIPRRETIQLPAIEDRKIPALWYREVNYREASDGDWAARNRLTSMHSGLTAKHGGKAIVYKNPPGVAHTFRRLVNAETHFAHHPEYFAEIDGERAPDGQPCLTNTDVAAHVIGGVRHRLAQQQAERGVNVVSVSQNDGQTHYCRCDRCTALAEHEGSQSGPIIHFVNQVADKIKDDYPDVAIDTLAYGYTRKPPQHVRPRPNVIVRLSSSGGYQKVPAPDGGFQIRHHAFTEDEIIVGWSKICKNLHTWYYVLDDEHFLMPGPNLYSIQPNIKFIVDHNVTGIFVQGVGHPGGEFAELRSYLIARALWDPDGDWEADINEFVQAYYGPAAGPIRQYIALLHEWPETDEVIIERRFRITREFVKQADLLFDEAEAAVADDPVLLLRVRKERLGLIYIKLISDPRSFFPTWQEHGAAVEQFAAISGKYGITQAGEGQKRKLAPRLEQWRQEVELRRQAEESE